MSRHDDRAIELIAHEAAQFIAREAGTQSLITVTRAELGARGERATIYVSVFPEEQATPALAFLTRMRGAFRDHLTKHARIRPLPAIDFVFDEGEVNRRRLDELGRMT